jgi:hypothetical protein
MGDEMKNHTPDAKKDKGPKLTSAVPERVEGELNPSSPANTGTTPGSNAKVG